MPRRRVAVKRTDITIQNKVEKLKNKGYKVFPSTEQLVKQYTSRASEKGLITTNEELLVCQSALLSAGAKTATESKKKTVTVRDIKKGWRSISILGGNCPPHKCMRRSIIEQKDKLLRTLPGFEDLIKE